jgi:hypothetical protein
LNSYGEEINTRTVRCQPAFFAPTVLPPPAGGKTVGNLGELIDIHPDRNVHILRSAIVVNPHPISGRADDHSLYVRPVACSSKLAQRLDLFG